MKPVTRANLLDAILKALGEGRQRYAKSSSNLPAPVGRPLHILLAEDNIVNQKVAARLDVQMPVMNGFDTTQAIRTAEQETGKHIPIIALTAHAMKGDRETCLKAGMDDYLGKPIHPRELVAVLERWSKPGVAPN